MRRTHWLATNEANEQPGNIIWLDTETRYTIDPKGRQRHYLWFGWACFQRKYDGAHWTRPDWIRFETVGAFWEWVINRTRAKTRLYLFAHNGAFDLPVLSAFSELPGRGFKLINAVVDAPPMIIDWKRDKATIRFVDTLNIWRMPLAQVGKSVGIPKLAMPEPDAPKADWEAYGKNDVEVIRAAVLQWLDFLKANDLGGFAPTLAGQAFKAYRHRFMQHPILIDDNPDAQALARAAYVGGRCECFKIGEYEGDFWLLDVNSMYPAVMQHNVYPTRLLGVYGRPTFREMERWLTHRAVIVEVELDTDEPAYPLVADGKLIFPTGRFRAVLSGPELGHALVRGHVRRATSAAVYAAEQIFTGFVSFMWNERQRARAAEDAANTHNYKIMANSLYGKFGQRGRRYETSDVADIDDVDVWDEIDLDDGSVRHYRKFGGITQHWVDEGEARESMPAISAYIASYARLVLWNVIELAGRDHTYYCDTDSLVVDAEGYQRLAHLVAPEQLGGWKIEQRLKRLHLRGPKDYTFDSVTKVKGVRKSARWLDADTIRQDYFVGFRGLLREGDLSAPLVTQITKRLARQYTKGTVSPSGDVLPLHLGDGD